MELDVAVVVETVRDLLTAAGFQFVRIVSATPDETKSIWTVKADVGVTSTIMKEATIDDRTGKVIEYH